MGLLLSTIKFLAICMLHMLIQIHHKEGLAEAAGEDSNITTPILVGGVSVIITAKRNTVWVSPNNTFALGFLHNPSSSSASSSSPSFTLTLFYSFLSQFHTTPVWTPLRGHLLTQNASLQLTPQGDLVLSDSGTQIWHTNTAGRGVASFLVSDQGNILLYSQNSSIIWQSWDEPITDTLLPGQSLLINRDVVDSTGRYWLTMQADGNLVLYFLGSLSYSDSANSYWASNTNTTQAAYYNASQGLMLLGNTTGHIVTTLLQSSSSAQLERMVMSQSGIFIRYMLSADGKSWFAAAQVPSSVCYVIGLCGPYGICNSNDDPNDIANYTCTCPDGFDYVDVNDWSMGCRTNYPFDCDLGTNMTKLFGVQYSVIYTSVASHNWVYHFNNNPSSEDECAQSCNASCRCAAATYDGVFCHLSTVGQVNTGNTKNSTYVTYLKTSVYPANNSTQNNTSLQPNGKDVKERDTKRVISIGAAVGIGVPLGLACIVGCANLAWWYYKSENKQAHMDEEGEDEVALLGGGPVHFSYKELKAASNGFTDLLGRGGFGPVYRGVLAGGSIVAIKKLEGSTFGEKQFRAEVITIGNVHHINLVRLRGYCAKVTHRMLVYQFMPKGSLDKYIFCDSSIPFEAQFLLSWESRFQILLSTARAIKYLHEECEPFIVHCDIKPENILLDEAFNAKVSDFGMAQLVGGEAGLTGSITRVRGTVGYMAPEWMSSKHITTKADVYSFGIVMLEVISGRRVIDINAESVSMVNLPNWAYSQVIEHCDTLRVLDPRLRLHATSDVPHLGTSSNMRHHVTMNVLHLTTSTNLPHFATSDVLDHATSESMPHLVPCNVPSGLRVSDLAEFHRVVFVALWCIHKDPSVRPSMGRVLQILEGTVSVDTPPYPF